MSNVMLWTAVGTVLLLLSLLGIFNATISLIANMGALAKSPVSVLGSFIGGVVTFIIFFVLAVFSLAKADVKWAQRIRAKLKRVKWVEG